MGSFRKSNLLILCRECCPDHVVMDVADLTRHLDKDTFDTYLRARDELLIVEAMRETVEKHAKQVSELKADILKLCAQREAVVLHHRVRIIEEILTLKCPRVGCRVAFVDFEDCFALTCHACKCGFCAYCLEDCGENARLHVARCEYNTAPGKTVFALFGAASFEGVQREKRQLKLAEDVKDEVDVGLRAAVVEAMQQDLQDIGIDVARLRRDCWL